MQQHIDIIWKWIPKDESGFILPKYYILMDLSPDKRDIALSRLWCSEFTPEQYYNCLCLSTRDHLDIFGLVGLAGLYKVTIVIYSQNKQFENVPYEKKVEELIDEYSIYTLCIDGYNATTAHPLQFASMQGLHRLSREDFPMLVELYLHPGHFMAVKRDYSSETTWTLFEATTPVNVFPGYTHRATGVDQQTTRHRTQEIEQNKEEKQGQAAPHATQKDNDKTEEKIYDANERKVEDEQAFTLNVNKDDLNDLKNEEKDKLTMQESHTKEKGKENIETSNMHKKVP